MPVRALPLNTACLCTAVGRVFNRSERLQFYGHRLGKAMPLTRRPSTCGCGGHTARRKCFGVASDPVFQPSTKQLTRLRNIPLEGTQVQGAVPGGGSADIHLSSHRSTCTHKHGKCIKSAAPRQVVSCAFLHPALAVSQLVQREERWLEARRHRQ